MYFSVFILATIIKTIQGSSTVAIVTTCAITAPILQSIGMTSELEKVILIISIGSGAMTISHVNDSYFWVVTKYSNIEMNDVLKYFSSATLIQGLTGLVLSIFMTGLTFYFNNSLVPLSNKYSEILLRDGLGKSVSMEKGTDIFFKGYGSFTNPETNESTKRNTFRNKYFLLERLKII